MCCINIENICFTALRSSHYESHVDGTSDYEFEFNKVLVFLHPLDCFLRVILFKYSKCCLCVFQYRETLVSI